MFSGVASTNRPWFGLATAFLLLNFPGRVKFGVSPGPDPTAICERWVEDVATLILAAPRAAPCATAQVGRPTASFRLLQPRPGCARRNAFPDDLEPTLYPFAFKSPSAHCEFIIDNVTQHVIVCSP
jgi:hypothetical protein